MFSLELSNICSMRLVFTNDPGKTCPSSDNKIPLSAISACVLSKFFKTRLEKDESGVPSPISSSYVSPQCLLVPCLGIDREGYRLGYGAGWYDRFLADAAIETIGVLSEEFLLQSLPHEAHDRPLSGYVNENGLTFVKPLPSGNPRKNQ